MVDSVISQMIQAISVLCFLYDVKYKHRVPSAGFTSGLKLARIRTNKHELARIRTKKRELARNLLKILTRIFLALKFRKMKRIYENARILSNAEVVCAVDASCILNQAL